ncbi:DUF3828 domain-containing protein [Novosphingobium sp.]|uniref:DUF3828 domain-containing protein n=1 Tax=Novosphingobium sp. TaxID=1874826 RepID=UPI0035B342A5
MKPMRVVALCLLPFVLAAGKPAPAVSERAVDATLSKAYGPYYKENGGDSDWYRPVFSASTKKLIRAWLKHNGDELTGLSDYGWFCDCQDLDWKSFSWKRTGLSVIAPGQIEVTVKVNVGWDSVVEQRLVMVREGGRWVIDDLFSDSAPQGIKAAMQQELTEVPGS